MIISILRGNLDLTKHIEPQYVNQVLAMGSWCIHRGYIVGNCKSTKKKLLLHRLVYELAHGSIPAGLQIDHIDGNRSNNFLSNLRVVTSQQNNCNRTAAKGCYFHKPTQKWLAKIKLDGKSKHLGYYSTEAEAHQLYLETKAIYHIIKEEI